MRKHPFNNHSNMKSDLQQNQQGYILITVITTLFILASISVLLNRESSMGVNMTSNESRMTQARYVAEAGLNHALWQANNANCSGYANAVTANFGSDSYTISVSPTSGSPVSVTATSTLADGSKQSLTRNNITIMQSSGTSTILQPNAVTGIDTYVANRIGNEHSTNYGLDGQIRIGTGNGNGFIKFNLSSIPAGTQILKAEMALHFKEATSMTSAEISVHRLTQSWLEDQATWDEYKTGLSWTSLGGDYDSSVAATTTVTNVNNTWHKWNITELVNGWLSGTFPNNGLLIHIASGDVENAGFSSSDGVTTSNHPKLTLTFSCECGKICGPVSLCSGGGTFRDEFNTQIFTGSDGTLDWSGNSWQEVGESDGATSGDIRIRNDFSNYQLQTKDNDNGGEGVEREVDLSGASTASLEYEYRRRSLDNSNDYTTVEISANGAAGPWVELARYQGPDNDWSYTLVTHDISDYISSNTRIRLKTSPDMGGRDTVWFDSVEIQCSP